MAVPIPTGTEASNATAEQPLSMAPPGDMTPVPVIPATRASRSRVSLHRRLLRIEVAGRKDQYETGVAPESFNRFLDGVEGRTDLVAAPAPARRSRVRMRSDVATDNTFLSRRGPAESFSFLAAPQTTVSDRVTFSR